MAGVSVVKLWMPLDQGWGEYYSGKRLTQNDKHEYTKTL